MQTKEIPWTTPTDPLPLPSFSDANITVYAIPTLSEPPTSSKISTSTSSTGHSSPPKAFTSSPESSPEKRKRESSPVSPRKRLNPASLAPGRVILSEELLSHVTTNNFDPLTLSSGALADEYRTMIVKAMFPNTNSNPNLDPATRKENRRRSKRGMKAKALG